MRRVLRLALDSGGVAVIREVRPVDFKNALVQLAKDGDRFINDISAEEWDAALMLNEDLISITGQHNETENEAVSQAFVKLNTAFFGSETDGSAANEGKPQKLSHIERGLDNMCLALAGRGHFDVWYYGFGVFVQAQEMSLQ